VQDARPVEHWINAEWNCFNKVPVEDWLDHNMDEESKCRMKAVGNLVVPCQAQMGFAVLSRILTTVTRPAQA